MAGSQLKRLKASLREKGVIGPQLSKKQKKKNALEGKATNNRRLQKTADLAGIREQFNPFDFKHNARGPKFQVTSNRPATNAAKGRPGETKSLSEERRRQTLLVELNRRHKVGGILDRRFGENDPHMTPEEKMRERFVREKQSHKTSVFNLEDDEPSEGLTHLGKSLSFNEPDLADDFEEDLSAGSDGTTSDGGDDERRGSKRMRPPSLEAEDGGQIEGQPERKKTKQEVMKEVMAKSKFYKAERQAAKDADEDLREELDMELSDLRSLLFNSKRAPPSSENHEPGSAADAAKERMERDYDMRLRQLAQDRRAQPSDRTKTDEEKAQEESERLKELEEKRIKRMRGEQVSEDEGEDGNANSHQEPEPTNGPILFTETPEDNFGLGKGIKTRPTATELGFDDEDDFLIEEDLIASDSDLEPIEEDDASSDEGESNDDDDDEFTKGLLNEEEAQNPAFGSRLAGTAAAASTSVEAKEDPNGLPYTFPCPQSVDELVEMTQGILVEQLPTVVQRVRALYHPKLDSNNKSKLANFAVVLVRYLAHLSNRATKLPLFSILESLIRHIHSLAKSYPVEIANEFRSQLGEFGRSRPLSPNLGDFVVLTAVGSIFPTSDHFHQVATPASLLIARNLEKVPKSLADYAQGAYLSTLALQYQQVSKRYIPEVMNFCLNTLCALAPKKVEEIPRSFPVHEPAAGIRIANAQSFGVRKLTPADCLGVELSDEAATSAKLAILATTIQLLDAAADLFSGKSAFTETFEPVQALLAHLASERCRGELPAALAERAARSGQRVARGLGAARAGRRPLELHHHRPLAIAGAVPKFEEGFDPSKHYDPDRERAALARLRAEHRRERKGALRELRRDASFVAREQLRAKRARDEAYDRKYRRLVAEIQGEEGREANQYEREKQMRKRAGARK
ncbi:Nop14-like protein [Durotheca rogersii]|uniref:Nop14-like protein n=1 Tax=Durotheca rogersii TaxID=419775 RepID=UPI0022212185|nr:Nop14-like protein [Durotheca rogersii]KAI5862190.1 Nop14-like protein [Durotheca rogersii]